MFRQMIFLYSLKYLWIALKSNFMRRNAPIAAMRANKIGNNNAATRGTISQHYLSPSHSSQRSLPFPLMVSLYNEKKKYIPQFLPLSNEKGHSDEIVCIYLAYFFYDIYFTSSVLLAALSLTADAPGKKIRITVKGEESEKMEKHITRVSKA